MRHRSLIVNALASVGAVYMVVTCVLVVQLLGSQGYTGNEVPPFGYRLLQCVYKSTLTRHTLATDPATAPGSATATSFHDISSAFGGLSFASLSLPTDKFSSHNYTTYYDTIFYPWRSRSAPTRLLEVGVKAGGSLRLWRLAFPVGSSFVGLDVDPNVPRFDRDAAVKVVLADSRDAARTADALAGLPPFDIILDDGRHTPKSQCLTLRSLTPFLSQQGVYIVEDVEQRFDTSRLTPCMPPGWHWRRHADTSESLLVLYPPQSIAPKVTHGLQEHGTIDKSPTISNNE